MAVSPQCGEQGSFAVLVGF